MVVVQHGEMSGPLCISICEAKRGHVVLDKTRIAVLQIRTLLRSQGNPQKKLRFLSLHKP